MTSNQAHWLYLDLNSYFASCEQQDHPAYRNKPLAVVPSMADTTSVIAASYQAKRYGIKTGTRVGEAKKLCPHILLVEGHHRRYVEYHHQILAAVDTVLPIHSVCSIDEVACELTGSHRQIDRALELAQAVKSALRSQVGECLTASIGLGPNIFLSKVAADMQKPDGLTVIFKSEIKEKLSSLTLKDLPGIGPRMEARLWAQGIRTLPQLLAQNETQMRSLWGSIVGSRLYRLLQGESFEIERQSGQSIGHSHVLPPQLRTMKEAYYVALKLLDKAALRLRQARQLTCQIHLKIKFISGPSYEVSQKIENTNNTVKLAQILLKLWNRAPLKQKPIKIAVTLTDFISEGEEQLSFFEDAKKNQLYKFVDEINEKLGKKSLYLGGLHGFQDSAPTRIAFQRIPELDEVT